MQHLQDLGRDQQQDRVVTGQPPHDCGADDDERVEVEAPEVGAQPTAAAQPVGVGDVRVERGPDQVQPHAHGARRRATAARGRSMAELVEAGGEDGDGQHHEQQARSGERVMGGAGQAALDEHPPGDPGEHRERDRHQDRMEERGERGREPSGALRVGDDGLEAQRQQRVAAPQLGVATVVGRGEPEPAQLVGQLVDVVRRDLAAGGSTDVGGQLVVPALAVQPREDGVEQRGELDDLAVASPGKGRRLAVARAGHLAHELDAGGAGRGALRRTVPVPGRIDEVATPPVVVTVGQAARCPRPGRSWPWPSRRWSG